MTGTPADPDEGGRPRLRLVPGTGPSDETGPETGDEAAPGDVGETGPGADQGDEIEFVLVDSSDGFDPADGFEGFEEVDGTDTFEDDGFELVAGPGPDLDFLLVPLLTEAEHQMRSIDRPLDAEMWASELLGLLELGAPDGSTVEEREAATLDLATRLVDHAVDEQSPAVLRTLSVIGPAESRARARAAAVRMSAEGLEPPDWAAPLGRPRVGRCWRFADPEGSQESVTAVFDYGGQEHTLTVLIDHELGGGVKDCWVGEDPDGVLAEARAALEPDGIEVRFVPVEQVTRALSSALTRPECPGSPEESEDVALTRALLRARVQLLEGGPTAGGPDGAGTLEG